MPFDNPLAVAAPAVPAMPLYIPGMDVKSHLARIGVSRRDWALACLKNPAFTDPIRVDLYEVLDLARLEIPALLTAVREGRIDGSDYEGDCACLVGTIANVRGVNVWMLPTNARRLIEEFFRGIQPGDTPANSPISAAVEAWIVEYQAEHGEAAA